MTKTTGRAREHEVAALHSKLVAVFADILDNGEETVTKDGEVIRTNPKPATLNVIRQFLSDNGIEAAPNEAPESLTAKLPFSDDDRVVPIRG